MANSLIVKENHEYWLRDLHTNLYVGNDKMTKEDRVIVEKVFEKKQIFYKRTDIFGSFGLNQNFVKFALAEGKKEAWVNYKFADMSGHVLVDLQKLDDDGIPYPNPVSPYDEQFIVPRKALVDGMDAGAKAIYDTLWNTYKAPQLEQAKKLKEQKVKPISKEDLDKWKGNAPDSV